VNHVAVWYWNKEAGEKRLKLCKDLLPFMIVVDETCVKVGGKDAWIYVTLDPHTIKAILLEPLSAGMKEAPTPFRNILLWRHTGSDPRR